MLMELIVLEYGFHAGCVAGILLAIKQVFRVTLFPAGVLLQVWLERECFGGTPRDESQ